MTPEVFQVCEDITKEMERHSIGLHTHSYYHPEFLGWNNDGDSFRNYSASDKEQMIKRDIASFKERFGKVGLFRIARLEPDPTIMRFVDDADCVIDSSYHEANYGAIEKIKTRLQYRFREIPVTFHLYGLTPKHFVGRDRSVVLMHPSVPAGKVDEQVYDDGKLWSIMEACKSEYDFVGLDDLVHF